MSSCAGLEYKCHVVNPLEVPTRKLCFGTAWVNHGCFPKVKTNLKRQALVRQVTGIRKKTMFMRNCESMWHHCYFRHLYWFVHEERVSWTAFKIDSKPVYLSLVPPHGSFFASVFSLSSCIFHDGCLMPLVRSLRSRREQGQGRQRCGPWWRVLLPPRSKGAPRRRHSHAPFTKTFFYLSTVLERFAWFAIQLHWFRSSLLKRAETLLKHMKQFRNAL